MAATCFVLRFNTLGGGLGGFTNDQFAYMVRGRQILAGELPVRDFADPGLFLMSAASGLAQQFGGYSLRSEALLTVGALSVAAALTYLLAVSLTGSRVAAAAAVLLQIALEPRLYSYPKLLLYSAGVLLAWRYVRNPKARSALGLGLFVGLAGLFRHDHAVYLAGFAVLTVLMVHRRNPFRAAEGLGAGAIGFALIAVPFLAYVQRHQGVVEYFQAGVAFSRRDAARTSFRLPQVPFPSELPLSIAEVSTEPARVNVRWTGLDAVERERRERRYSLARPEPRGSDTWNYELQDTSRATLEALVRDPGVADTHGIDRQRFVPAGRADPRWIERIRISDAWRRHESAIAWLYYAFLAIPLLSALAWIALQRSGAAAIPAAELFWPLVALAVVLNVTFLSRGSTNIRIPDVGVTIALCAAFLIVAVAGGALRFVIASSVIRLGLRLALLTLGVAIGVSTMALNETLAHADAAGFDDGISGVSHRMQSVSRQLGVSPPLDALAHEASGAVQLMRYLHGCTAARDRLFVLGDRPELYYFADRLFAGGHASLLAGFFATPAEQELIVARLRSSSVPVVITEREAVYRSDYAPTMPLVDAELRRKYEERGDIQLGDGQVLRVLVERGRTAAGTAAFGLPCFDSRP